MDANRPRSPSPYVAVNGAAAPAANGGQSRDDHLGGGLVRASQDAVGAEGADRGETSAPRDFAKPLRLMAAN